MLGEELELSCGDRTFHTAKNKAVRSKRGLGFNAAFFKQMAEHCYERGSCILRHRFRFMEPGTVAPDRLTRGHETPVQRAPF